MSLSLKRLAIITRFLPGSRLCLSVDMLRRARIEMSAAMIFLNLFLHEGGITRVNDGSDRSVLVFFVDFLLFLSL